VGRAPTGERQYAIKFMWDRHHEIKRRIVLGHTNDQIAQVLGITPQTVSNVRNSPIVMMEVERLRAERDKECIDLAKELAPLQEKALAVYREIFDGEGEGSATIDLKYKAAKDILQPGGLIREPHKVRAEVAHGIFTMQELEEIKNRVKFAKAQGQVVEAEVVEG